MLSRGHNRTKSSEQDPTAFYTRISVRVEGCIYLYSRVEWPRTEVYIDSTTLEWTKHELVMLYMMQTVKAGGAFFYFYGFSIIAFMEALDRSQDCRVHTCPFLVVLSSVTIWNPWRVLKSILIYYFWCCLSLSEEGYDIQLMDLKTSRLKTVDKDSQTTPESAVSLPPIRNHYCCPSHKKYCL